MSMGITILGPKYGPGETDVRDFFTNEEGHSFLVDPVRDMKRSLQQRVFPLFDTPEERQMVSDLIVVQKRAPEFQKLIREGNGEVLAEQVHAILEFSKNPAL